MAFMITGTFAKVTILLVFISIQYRQPLYQCEYACKGLQVSRICIFGIIGMLFRPACLIYIYICLGGGGGGLI